MWWLSAGEAMDWRRRTFSSKKSSLRRVALLERGHIGQGNSGRNTQVTRSNYFYPVSSSFFDHSLKLYEGLSRELPATLSDCRRAHPATRGYLQARRGSLGFCAGGECPRGRHRAGLRSDGLSPVSRSRGGGRNVLGCHSVRPRADVRVQSLLSSCKLGGLYAAYHNDDATSDGY